MHWQCLPVVAAANPECILNIEEHYKHEQEKQEKEVGVEGRREYEQFQGWRL